MRSITRTLHSCWFFTIEGCLLVVIAITAIGLLIGGWPLFMGNFTPHITSIPLLNPGETQIEVIGEHFGERQGTVWVSSAGSGMQLMDALEWEDERLLLQLPKDVTAGTITIEQQTGIGKRVSAPHDFLTRRLASVETQTNQAPTQSGSPWPTFRRDPRNSGRSPVLAEYDGSLPWTFTTGKGIFSTPIIDAQGAVYVGSADHFFYALKPDGSLAWKYETGEIIDSAGALFDAAPDTQEAGLVFISGDGNMYGFDPDDKIADPEKRLLWKVEAELRPEVSYNRWFEGNVAVGPDGSLYAGNTNFYYYAISPTGELKWTYATDSNNWSQAAFGPDGTIYWGSNDTFVRAVSPSGNELWRKRTLGFIAASAAVGSDGTVYIGSFDSNLYALDPATGKTIWRFPTRDHIYSSAALGEDEQGNTNAIYFGSADGSLYALAPNGSLLWRYDTGDPIRSSPVIGLAPTHSTGNTGDQVSTGEVVYCGSGNGKLYAIHAADGSLRWAYDTTPEDPELQDRNDLNGSPALGDNGIYIGGEHGALVYVPYDYCLNANDPRCSIENADLPSRLSQVPELQTEQVGLYYVTPGGSTLVDFPETLPTATMVTLRLVAVEDGQTVDAYVCNSPIGCPADSLQVELKPSAPFQVEHSADGRYIYIRPDGFLIPDTEYELTMKGKTYARGIRLGNLTLFGLRGKSFESSFRFRTEKSRAAQPPLEVSEAETSALELTRLAVPIPPMLPSLNQIGFDYLDWIVGTISITPPDIDRQGKILMWAVGAERNDEGVLVVDPESDFTLPLSGSYQNEALVLANQEFKMAITGIDIPFNRFELRGVLGMDGVMQPGATAYADTEALSIPTFGPYLVVAGLANNIYERLLVAGTYITRPYPADGPANKAPAGVKVSEIDYKEPTASQDGLVTASFNLTPGASYALDEHRPGILLVDAVSGEAVYLDYHAQLNAKADKSGNLESVSLRIPAGTTLPEEMKAYVIVDVFPLAEEVLSERK